MSESQARAALPPRNEDPAHDRHRPRYHFLPPANWMNDPNGLIAWGGQYHLFYQYNPDGPFWGNIHWGHAVSSDLVHWADRDVALAPTPGGVDADGCWSGCAVNNNGVPTLIYTGVRGEQQLPCLATSDSTLGHWTKHTGNPLISAPPDLDLIGFRDPAVWRENDSWYQIIGAGIRDKGGAALLYRSPDLLSWEYLHPLYATELRYKDIVSLGSMWECPQFVQLGEQHMLLISVWDARPHSTVAMIGSYRDQRFSPRHTRRLDYGDAIFYAPQTLVEPQGRTLLWGWIQEDRSDADQRAAGWAGVMSLPRVLSLTAAGDLGIAPAPELANLRGLHYSLTDQEIGALSKPSLADLRGDSLEIRATIDPQRAESCGITLRCAPDGGEQTRVIYDRQRGWLGIDSTQSSRMGDSAGAVYGGPLVLAAGESLELHIYLDRSVLEVFANGRACITARIYPSGNDSLGLRCFAFGSAARLRSLEAWELRSIWL